MLATSLAVVEPLAIIGGIATLIGAAGGAIGGVMAFQSNKRSAEAEKIAANTAHRAATREETQQALDAQGILIERQDKRIIYLEERNAELHGKINDVLAKSAVMLEEHKHCERRLALAEARIAELGG